MSSFFRMHFLSLPKINAMTEQEKFFKALRILIYCVVGFFAFTLLLGLVAGIYCAFAF